MCSVHAALILQRGLFFFAFLFVLCGLIDELDLHENKENVTLRSPHVRY